MENKVSLIASEKKIKQPLFLLHFDHRLIKPVLETNLAVLMVGVGWEGNVFTCFCFP
jgi:hypothetical protein